MSFVGLNNVRFNQVNARFQIIGKTRGRSNGNYRRQLQTLVDITVSANRASPVLSLLCNGVKLTLVFYIVSFCALFWQSFYHLLEMSNSLWNHRKTHQSWDWKRRCCRILNISFFMTSLTVVFFDAQIKSATANINVLGLIGNFLLLGLT